MPGSGERQGDSAPVAKPVLTVSVRELVEFVLKQGDLAGKREFTGSDRALAGIRGHQKVQRSRPPGYRTEIPLEYQVEVAEFSLRIRGRIDGLLIENGRTLLEEIKTVQGSWNQQADPLHWAQARFYGFIYARQNTLTQLAIHLVYLELETGKTTGFEETFSFTGLSSFFEETMAVYVEWLREQHHWRLIRNASTRLLAFPFPAYRDGQRKLAVAAYRTLAGGGKLFVTAPTGIGKTISTLFPAVKALGEGKLERIFYLTARTVIRAIAEKAVADLRKGGLKLRAVTLTAREKICVRDGQPCDVLTCPLARGYYNRVKPAMYEALELEVMDRTALETVGQKHQVCPYELSLDVSVWSDVVIGDYNYAFDPQVYLRRHFEEGGEYGLLIDEAHNLPDRAREMFSAELDGAELHRMKRASKTVAPRCSRALGKLQTMISKLAEPAAAPDEAGEFSDPLTEPDLFLIPATTRAAGKKEMNTSPELPDGLLELLESALAETESWLVKNQPAEFREDLLALYFRLHAFRRTAEIYNEHFTIILERVPTLRLRLFCVDPSELLQQALVRSKAAVFFSATLSPLDYYRQLSGGSLDDPLLQLASPFPPENLAVLIHDRIQTHFKGRTGSLNDTARTIGTFVQGRRGNYLIYFPSYHYLNAALIEFQAMFPKINVLVQKPGMTEPERETFLDAFSTDHEETLAGFVVLGGIFGEGIDLVGDRLIGAVIVGTGLPQLSVERDLIRNYFQNANGNGFEFAYTFPGMNRVLQAVGRVIRSETDRGMVLLIDTRFSEIRYRRLFPAWWKIQKVRNLSALETAVAIFWQRQSSVS